MRANGNSRSGGGSRSGHQVRGGVQSFCRTVLCTEGKVPRPKPPRRPSFAFGRGTPRPYGEILECRGTAALCPRVAVAVALFLWRDKKSRPPEARAVVGGSSQVVSCGTRPIRRSETLECESPIQGFASRSWLLPHLFSDSENTPFCLSFCNPKSAIRNCAAAGGIDVGCRGANGLETRRHLCFPSKSATPSPKFGQEPIG